MFSWNKNPNEKRAFVKPGTGEPAAKIVQDDHGEVIGRATTENDEKHLIQEHEEDMRQAA